MRNQFYKKITFLMLISILLLGAGCDKLQTEHSVENEGQKQNEEMWVSASKSTEDHKSQNSKEEVSPQSIAYKDWAVEQNSLEGTDNLYTLNIPEIVVEGNRVIDIISYGEYCLVVLETADCLQHLYIIHPLDERVVASYELAYGLYEDTDAIYVDDAGEIIVRDVVDGNIHILDKTLKEQQIIHVGETNGNNMFLTENRQYVYYSADGRRFYCYNVESGETEQILSDVEVSEDAIYSIKGLLNNDTCILLSYMKTEEWKEQYEVRNLATGELVSSGEGSFMDVEEKEGNYYMQAFMEGTGEVVFGNVKDSEAKVLAPKDYQEYEMCNSNLSAMAVATCCYTTEESAVQYTVYDLNSGMREKKVLVSDVQPQDSMEIGLVTLIPETDSCVCVVNAATPRLLVWDLTKESSDSQDNRTYLYSWKDLQQLEGATLVDIEERVAAIEKEYYVDIIFGDEVEGATSLDYEIVPSYNAIRIDKTLDILEKALSKYPKSLLKQLDFPGWDISKPHIYLADDLITIDEGHIEASGVHYEMDGKTNIAVDMNGKSDLEGTIHHELFHVIENYVNCAGGFYYDETWDTLNPEDFQYDYDYIVNESNMDNSYTVSDIENEAYFIDIYGKSFPHEDRARIMEYTMLDDGDMRKDNISSEKIQEKLRYICEVLRRDFDATDWPKQTFWEKACDYIE